MLISEDRSKAPFGGVWGDKISKLSFSPKILHMGHDALHRDPSFYEGPLAILLFSRGSFSVFSVSRARPARGGQAGGEWEMA
jgi:hypothetical protein